MMDDSNKKPENNELQELEDLFDKHAQGITHLILKLTGNMDETEDLVQEVFIKAFQKISSFKGNAALKTWLYRIAVNTVWDYFRRKRYRRVLTLEGLRLISREKVRKNVARNELQEIVNHVFALVPLKYRIVLVLREIQGYSYKEIAHILKCRIGTVESRLFRARKSFLKKLKQESYWEELHEM